MKLSRTIKGAIVFLPDEIDYIKMEDVTPKGWQYAVFYDRENGRTIDCKNYYEKHLEEIHKNVEREILNEYYAKLFTFSFVTEDVLIAAGEISKMMKQKVSRGSVTDMFDGYLKRFNFNAQERIVFSDICYFLAHGDGNEKDTRS